MAQQFRYISQAPEIWSKVSLPETLLRTPLLTGKSHSKRQMRSMFFFKGNFTHHDEGDLNQKIRVQKVNKEQLIFTRSRSGEVFDDEF